MKQEPGKHLTKGVPTRHILVAAMILVITSVTVSTLWVVRNRLQRGALKDASSNLIQSANAFLAADAQRLKELQRENLLMADLPSLRALMTTGDQRTITDGAARFWKMSDTDLFALVDNDNRLVTLYTRRFSSTRELTTRIAEVTGEPNRHFLLADGNLLEYAAQPLLFGSGPNATSLGYLVTGYIVTSQVVRQMNVTPAADVALCSRQQVVTSTIRPDLWKPLGNWNEQVRALPSQPVDAFLGQQRYLAYSIDLSSESLAPLNLLLLKSSAQAEQARRELNRLLTIVGACALCAGTVLMLLISSAITAPLERLTKNVRDYEGDGKMFSFPSSGTKEVREMSEAFLAMSNQIRIKNQALFESERLATIGRMASSVSHDLRHYLAAVYANAEFLVSPHRPQVEREELFDEIRMAVLDTTDLIDSLLTFSRPNETGARVSVPFGQILERASALVRKHPDARNIRVDSSPQVKETFVTVDPKQMERAVYNLLLNACQAARTNKADRCVTAQTEVTGNVLSLHVTDNGSGVADAIRETLFQPFVSQGKQNGTGLGLTIANVVAQDHGGRVALVRSRPGETVFTLSILRA